MVIDIDAEKDVADKALQLMRAIPGTMRAFNSPLCEFDNVILTPHIGGSTQEAQENIGLEVSGKLAKYSDNGSTLSAVNFPEVSLPMHGASASRLVPETASTQNMIGAEELALMKPGALLINAARGTVIDIPALCHALSSKHLAGAAIDVFPTEPATNSDPGSYEARGKKLGIIGYGHIGMQLGVLAEGLGMHVFFYDIENKLPLGNATQVRHLSDLLNMSDVVSLQVGCFCIGTNQVDLNAAARRGIPVFNAPFSNTRSVAELVIGEMLLMLRGIPEANAKAHRGIWNKVATFLLVEGVHQSALENLRAAGYTNIEFHKGALDAESLKASVRDAHFIGIRSRTQLTEEIFAAAEKLVACSRHPAILYGFVLPESRGVLPWSQSFVLPHCQNLLFWQKVILWHSTLNSE
ncbi:hypothetical protein CRX72_03630 [Pantoea sp. BRM17]|nr:hypothetical protein CRX72_03630 [Pantoea sp. BRM17]